MNFKVFVKTTITEPTITLMFIVCWHQQKIGKFLFCLQLIFSAYLKKWCGQELSKFWCKKLSKNLQSRWCLLSDDLIRTKIFIFVLILIHFCCLINPWWLEFLKFLWKEPSVNLRKLISSLDLINCWWLKLRANKPITTLVLDTRWHNQNWSIRDINRFFFVGENIDDLKFSTFFKGCGGDAWEGENNQ